MTDAGTVTAFVLELVNLTTMPVVGALPNVETSPLITIFDPPTTVLGLIVIDASEAGLMVNDVL